MDDDVARLVAFFFVNEIRMRNQNAIRAALEFREAFNRIPLEFRGDQRDDMVLDALQQDLDWAIRTGAVVFEKVKPVVAPKQKVSPEPAEVLGPSPGTTPAQPSPAIVADNEPHWIEVQVLDLAGRPIPDLPYELTLPDGSKRSGSLDSSGMLVVEDIAKAGHCKLELNTLGKNAEYQTGFYGDCT